MSVLASPNLPLLADADYASLKAHILALTGLAYYADKDEEFAYRLSLRMSARHLTRAGDYLAMLRGGPAGERELDLLIEHLTIGETHFFRHPVVFAAMNQCVLPDVLKRAADGRVRIWSAASSFGAEAYSLAILMKQWQPNVTATIVGTDISRRALERAHHGEFSDWDLRGTSDEIRNSCFRQTGSTWAIASPYREGVTFQYHNLVQHPFPSLLHNLCAFDVIFCRNVLMYFDVGTMRRVVEQLYASLVEGGWLIVGHAEPNGDVFSAFQTVNVPGAVLYRKVQAPGSTSRPAAQFGMEVAGHCRDANALADTLLPAEPAPSVFPSVGAASHAVIEAAAYAQGLARVRALANTGNLGDAETSCRELLEAQPMDAVLHLHLALIVAQGQRYDASIESLKKALYLDRELLTARLHLGLLYQRTGRRASARRAFQCTLAMLPGDAGQIIPHSDGMSAADLRELVTLQLEME